MVPADRGGHVPGRPDGLSLDPHPAHGCRTAFLPDPDGIGDDRPVPACEVKQPHGRQIDDDALPWSVGKDEHPRQQDAAAGGGCPDIRPRVGLFHGVVAEAEVPRDVRQRIPFPDTDRGQPADELLACRRGCGGLLDPFLHRALRGAKEPHLRGSGAGLEDQGEGGEGRKKRPVRCTGRHKTCLRFLSCPGRHPPAVGSRRPGATRTAGHSFSTVKRHLQKFSGGCGSGGA